MTIDDVAEVVQEVLRQTGTAAGVKMLYDVVSAAELLSTTPTRVHELRKSGALQAVQDGRAFKFRHQDLHAYINNLPTYEPGGAA